MSETRMFTSLATDSLNLTLILLFYLYCYCLVLVLELNTRNFQTSMFPLFSFMHAQRIVRIISLDGRITS